MLSQEKRDKLETVITRWDLGGTERTAAIAAMNELQARLDIRGLSDKLRFVEQPNGQVAILLDINIRSGPM